jgi:FtsZ-interacting cell division protein ZipA
MMRAANALAQGLRGQIVDDNRQPFDVDAAALVRTQIARFQERMASEGIPAGRELIRRLFAS